VLAGAGKPRQKASHRRARHTAAVRTTVSEAYERQLKDLRKKHQNACESLRVETERRRELSKKHKELAEVVRKLQCNVELDLKNAESRSTIAVSTAEGERLATAAQLGERHRLDLEACKARHVAELGRKQLETDHFQREAKRLREDRDKLRVENQRLRGERDQYLRQTLADQAERVRQAVLASTAPSYRRTRSPSVVSGSE
jgi:hypothetical protein